MLAQNFKTAADLDISNKRYVALLGVLGMLERDEIRHAPNITHGLAYGRKPRVKQCFFNMDDIFARVDCGTSACIAGSADFFFKAGFTGGSGLVDGLPENLIDLFCPGAVSQSQWKHITAEQAATALRSYLTTGEANWADALR